MRLRPLNFFKKVFPDVLWDIPSVDKTVYLTFDDGPTPGVTSWLLDLLDEYDAKATFFCLARNVDRNPEIFKDILERGHAVGNHTYSHLKGRNVTFEEYMDDVELASMHVSSVLFRPPYARITCRQYRKLGEKYRFVMWSILSRDYSKRVSGQRCVRNVLKYVYPGAIVIFHDSLKCSEKLKYAMPVILKELTKKGYTFKSISL